MKKAFTLLAAATCAILNSAAPVLAHPGHIHPGFLEPIPQVDHVHALELLGAAGLPASLAAVSVLVLVGVAFRAVRRTRQSHAAAPAAGEREL